VDESDTQRVSLKYTPHSFDLSRREYEPPDGKDVLLLIPCSQKKPYSESRTHSILFDKLGARTDRIHKVTVSGMYGPVPKQFETEQPVLEYEYVLAKEDTEQIEFVTDRVVRYLEAYGDQFDHVFGYVTSKTYRRVIEQAFSEYGRGKVLPEDPEALQLTEYFRNSNIDQLLRRLDETAG